MDDDFHKKLIDVLSYDGETGLFTWKTFRGNTAKKGSIAGWNHTDGYIRVMVFDRAYLAHRLAWFYIHGKWPEDEIDHADGDPKNNRIANLREASNSQNSHNRCVRKDSKTGHKGVSFTKYGTYKVRVAANGKRVHIGNFRDLDDAIAACKEMREKMHAEFANHG